MNYSSPFALFLRRVLSDWKILRPLQRLYRRILGGSYEDKFHNALLAAVRPGDTVWDVGANVGFYTQNFADWVGSTGKVVAFEPSPRVFSKLRGLAETKSNISLENVALSDIDGETDFYLDNREDGFPIDALAPILDEGASIDGYVSTRVMARRADSFLPIAPPSIIKIDVEGFELQVLNGMPQILSSAGLRAVFIEVHFLILAQRGIANAAATIVKMLRDKGFVISWTDPSHIFALRSN